MKMAASILVLSTALLVQPSISLEWKAKWRQPQDAAAAARSSDEYAWRLFVAINWPANIAIRAADPDAPFGADRPTVWETWQNSTDTFLEDGMDPGPWREIPNVPSVAVGPQRFENLLAERLPNVRHIVNGAMVALVDPLSTAPRLIETRLNRQTYEYIRARGLFSIGGQLRAVAGPRPVEFPAGSMQVKAGWRLITPAEQTRYHTLAIRLKDGQTRLYGLTSLNIASKALPSWFWASFEHVDNAARIGGEGWQLPSRDRFACRGRAFDCNLAPPGIGLDQTVWRFYRLRGTMTSFVDPSGRPRLLANSDLEIGLQKTASCITCHARAAIGSKNGAPARLSAFESDSAGPATHVPARRGYVGMPDPAWFVSIDGPGASRTIFRPLDFVWSLAQAKAQPRPEGIPATTISGDPP
jgi:hypothetical protein